LIERGRREKAEGEIVENAESYLQKALDKKEVMWYSMVVFDN